VKKILAALMLLVIGCGYPNKTHCGSSIFGHGYDSVLPLDCSLMDPNFEVGVQMIQTYALHVDTEVYRQRMRHVHVEVKSVDEWKNFGTEIIGLEHTDPVDGRIDIDTDEYGFALLHETLHAYDDVGYWDSVGGVLAYPSEGIHEMNHDGWLAHCYDIDEPGVIDAGDDRCGYYDADHHYEWSCYENQDGGCRALQPDFMGYQ
jgi:hypothetical protein